MREHPAKMKTIQLNTESYLFKDSGREFRAIPFYELEFNEWVIYEDGIPKYYFELHEDAKDKVILSVIKDLKRGKELDSIIQGIGKKYNKNWTTINNIKGLEINNSFRSETIELTWFDSELINNI